MYNQSRKSIRPLLSAWVKDPELYSKCIIICSECLINDKNIFSKVINNGDIVLTACPEKECNTYFGKIATIMRCSRPSKIIVITRDGSPHCRVLHNAALQALFLTDIDIELENYVVFEGSLVKISKETIVLSRYLSLMENVISNYDLRKVLEKLSEEYKSLSKFKDL